MSADRWEKYLVKVTEQYVVLLFNYNLYYPNTVTRGDVPIKHHHVECQKERKLFILLVHVGLKSQDALVNVCNWCKTVANKQAN